MANRFPVHTIKNCGILTPEARDAAVASGARFIGFIHHPGSPRYCDIETAALLALHLPPDVASVAVLVNPDDNTLKALTPPAYPDMVQLHGDEIIARIAEIRRLVNKPVIKAVGIGASQDIAHALNFQESADALLLDYKSAQHGGTGQSFDWALLKDFQPTIPWFLSGGLTIENITEAIQTTHAPMIDVSSGIESQAGVKDLEKIRKFNLTARKAFQHAGNIAE